ncbi:hypothetical protein [Fodinicola feengrottensis]|uniref:hypothetical protein n=1 Tax=Fodinicola feengrottensis TaxID=435914 RepID=UPI0013D09CA1|nr:hypothetical protein [Fodinicola feengrottensis]
MRRWLLAGLLAITMVGVGACANPTQVGDAEPPGVLTPLTPDTAAIAQLPAAVVARKKSWWWRWTFPVRRTTSPGRTGSA